MKKSNVFGHWACRNAAISYFLFIPFREKYVFFIWPWGTSARGYIVYPHCGKGVIFYFFWIKVKIYIGILLNLLYNEWFNRLKSLFLLSLSQDFWIYVDGKFQENFKMYLRSRIISVLAFCWIRKNLPVVCLIVLYFYSFFL